MRRIFKPRYSSSTVIFWLLFTGLAVIMDLAPPGSIQVWADPAFLAAGTTPNLLIIIDNSESMLDLAYMPDNGACHDKVENDDREISMAEDIGYERTTTYAGYFASNDWYTYNSPQSFFEVISKPAACTSIDGSAYTNTRYGIEDLCFQLHNSSIEIKARGNLLNWATASRFDIQKKVLTGGKFNPLDRTLISEGRGCPGTRFIRQLPIWNVATGTAHILSLGIRATDPGHDQTTAMEVFTPLPTGFDNKACQSVFDNMPSYDNAIDTLNTLLANCLENSTIPFEIPKAADPTAHMPHVDNPVNLPALLTDVLAEQQLGPPLMVMKGVIHDPRYDSAPPRGILHDTAGKLRVGIMQFNYDGSQSECSLQDEASENKALLEISQNDCSGASMDGSRVLVDIGNGTPDHINNLIRQVNSVKADAWSPLAEAVFSAIGYYTQRPDMRINASDFSMSAEPCTHWCQSNNILVITDGASTVDRHPQMTNFASMEGQNDGNRDNLNGCPELYGSSFLDDITAYGFSGNNIHLEDPFDVDAHFQNIKTYFVIAGTISARGQGECAPTTLLAEAAINGGSGAPFYADDLQNLADTLKAALNIIRAGSYASPVPSFYSAGPNDGGAIYQARFWPAVDAPPGTDSLTPNHRVTWLGDVTALLMDADGSLFEDTDGNNALNTGDEQITIFYDNEVNGPRVCTQEVGPGETCQGFVKPLDQVHHLWSAAEWLAGIADDDVNTNREEYISIEKKRFIFSWNDLDNNGAVTDDEVLPFVPLDDWYGPALSTAADRAPVPMDFNVTTSEEVNHIIRWIRGLDNPLNPSHRLRQVARPPNFSLDDNPETITWRLGDVIHSTPTVVAGASENYHLLYADDEYAAFAEVNLHRRQVIYFGGNDGMVHALNGGFYDAAHKKFWRGYDKATRIFSDAGPALGAELWAYVPYNLLPHLKHLPQAGYRHTYYVDLTPRVFDVQIFDSSPNSLGHINGWGTIMVVGMRLGGERISAQELIAETSSQTTTDERIFTSTYMVFDISDPENPPRLLGEMTYQPQTSLDLAFTTALPVVVSVAAAGNRSDWFLVLGSGPTHSTGLSTQNASIGVFPLAELDEGQAFRIPATAAYSHASAGSFELTGSPNGFISGMTAVDFDLEDLYQTDVVYFGTIEGGWGDWGGRMYRWLTHPGYPQNWIDPAMMIDAKRPITTAPVVGFDGGFYWVYFGTGRFFNVQDKTDPSSNAQDYFFGLKEPVDSETGAFTWAPIQNRLDIAPLQPGNNAGSRTLLRVDQIGVTEAVSASTALLNCRDSSACLPDGVATFKNLQNYIVGTCDTVMGCTGIDGWVHAFGAPRERNLGQGTLLGGLINFTTYEPFQGSCYPEGESYLYSLHFQTGTAYYASMVDAGAAHGISSINNGSRRLATMRRPVGKGLATAPRLFTGRQQGSKAFVQTSAGAFVGMTQPILPVKTTKSGRLNWRSN
jgi:type IV pilus assembly protein PilY1